MILMAKIFCTDILVMVEKGGDIIHPINLISGLRSAEDEAYQFYANMGYKNEGLIAKLYLRNEV